MNPLKPFCKQTAIWLCLACSVLAVPMAANAALLVASPAPGQVIYQGTRSAITWTSDLSPDADVTIKLLDFWDYLDVGRTKNSGYFEWDVPTGIFPTMYELAFFDGSGQVLLANPVPVFLDPPPLKVLFPDHDSVVLKGKPYTITWINYDRTSRPLEVYLVGGPDGDVLDHLGTVDNVASQFSFRVPRNIPKGANYQVVLQAVNYTVASQPFLILQRLPRLPR